MEQVTFMRGMDQDSNPKYLADGSYRYALNAVPETKEGEGKSIISKLGNSVCGELLGIDQTLNGAILLDDGTFMITTVSDLGSAIHIFDPKACTITLVLSSNVTDPDGDCLKFTACNPIRGTFRVINGCERMVYFTDGKETLRAVNLDKPEDYMVNGVTNCNLLDVSPSVSSIPCFDDLVIRDSGGAGMKLGSVKFAVRLVTRSKTYTNFLRLSRNIPIVYEKLSNEYYSIFGSTNQDLTTNITTPDDNPLSTKSIEIQLGQLDTSFEYFQVAALHIGSGTGSITETFLGPLVPITGTNQTWLYRGNSSDVTEFTAEEVLVDKQVVDVVQDVTQLDNQLMIAHLSEKSYDWATVQRQANTITSEYVSKTLSNESIEEGMKGANYYLHNTSFMRDEVYSFGIKGRLKKGGKSTPVFHIPGREEITDQTLINQGNTNYHYRSQVNFGIGGANWDRNLLTVVDPTVDNITLTNDRVSLDNVRHLGFNELTDDIGDGIGQVQRWKVYNTFISNNLFGEGNTSGLMGYYETEQQYPDTVDQNGVRIYPTGAIRHHKFPDSTHELPWVSSTTPIDPRPQSSYFVTDTIAHRPIGVRFNIDTFLGGLPQDLLDDVVEWEIVQAEQKDSEVSVVDKGTVWLHPSVFETDATAEGGDYTKYRYSKNVMDLYSPKTMFERDLLREDYLKVEFLQETQLLGIGNPFVSDFNLNSINFYMHHDIDFNNTQNFTSYNLAVNSSLYLNTPSTFTFEAGILNNTISPVYGNHGYPLISDYNSNFRVWNNHSSVHKYNIVTASYLDDSIPNIDYELLANRGDSSIPFDVKDNTRRNYYVSAKRYLPNMYSNLGALQYFSIDNCGYTSNRDLYKGNTFTSRFNINFFLTREDDGTASTTEGDAFAIDGDVIDLISESKLNVALRNKGDTTTGNIYEYHLDLFGKVSNRQIISAVGDTPIQADPLLIKDYLEYNIDYNILNEFKPCFPLDESYDYSNECINLFPFRIRYSEKADQYSDVDNYRSFLVNDFRDIPGETGSIERLFVQNDKLYALTERAPYFIVTRPQTLETNESTAFIGLGTVLSVPPQKLVTTRYSYGGCKDPMSVVTTEYGTLWVDEQAQTVFNLTDKLENINGTMDNFFKENIELKLNCQIRELFGLSYGCREVSNYQSGIGFTATYDTHAELYYLTKKDYCLLNPTDWVLLEDAVFPGQLIYDPEAGVLGEFIGAGTYDTIDLNNSDHISVEHFTMSYYLPTQAWYSFYSFYPNFMFNNADTFFTTRDIGPLQIWKHNKGEYLNFYGTKYPHELEFYLTSKKGFPAVYDSLSVITNTSQRDANKNHYVDINNVTFNNIVSYTEDQTTGLRPLVVKDKDDAFGSVLSSPLDVNIDRTTRDWRLNNLRDWGTNNYSEPLFTDEWTVLEPIWLANGYVPERLVNPAAVDTTQSQFNRSRLRGGYLGTKLIFNPSLTEDYRISTDLISLRSSLNKR